MKKSLIQSKLESVGYFPFEFGKDTHVGVKTQDPVKTVLLVISSCTDINEVSALVAIFKEMKQKGNVVFFPSTKFLKDPNFG